MIEIRTDVGVGICRYYPMRDFSSWKFIIDKAFPGWMRCSIYYKGRPLCGCVKNEYVYTRDA